MLSGTCYFQLSLTAPLVVPLFFFLISVAMNEVFALSTVLIISLAIGGGPYAIFAVAVLIWSRNRQPATLRKASYFAPLIFLVWALCFLLSPLLLLTGAEAKEIFGILLIFSAYTLVIGYFYVLLINAVYELFLSHRSEA